MIPEDEINRLMDLAIADKTTEPAFFRALLGATLYALAPRKSKRGRLHFIQFTTPQGVTVFPCFTDQAQAVAAAGGNATLVGLTGRQLLELTRGRILLLNPNSISCLLYPEEVAALLDRDEVAIVEQLETGDRQLRIAPPTDVPSRLIDQLNSIFSTLPSVVAAYALEIGDEHTSKERGLLIAVAVPQKDAERVARAVITNLHGCVENFERSIDLTSFEPGDTPDWLDAAKVAPIYERAPTRNLDLSHIQVH
ncbi:hypothetical protein G7069_08780 [Lysobacter sp. HDW10]|uniref:enhanced serine sensitivity protein SseB C-terminal domain-containing protein n=1 Tax=Lysobacter sp. HDW10 TaxID=2714936 RepID=UPI00140C567A|nr:enhanced serine sensitivity protein SseB C-terminal domain-containing protein [Lysobacter sp. HDW10]QIK81680.1 hypothetical protein G7069_08780 [Lysobacter sp. HDW10]